MTTNARTDESPASKLAPALCALLIVSIFVTSGVGYVWYKSVNAMLASEIIKLEPRLKDLVDLNRSREHQLAALSSPVELDARVKKMIDAGLVEEEGIYRIEVSDAGTCHMDNRPVQVLK